MEQSLMQTRKRKVDYRKLNDGEALPKEIVRKTSYASSRNVLTEQFYVERIISQKSTSECINRYRSMFKNLKSRCLHDEISNKNKSRQLRTLASESEKVLSFSEFFGLTSKSIKYHTKPGKHVTVNLVQKKNYCTLDHEEKQKLRELLYILDKFSISDAAYHELSMMDGSLPRKYLIVQERSELNRIFHIERTPGEKSGAYVSLKHEISNYIRVNKLQPSQTPIKVKLAGDGTRVSRLSSFTTLTLSFPDMKDCASINNIRTVAIVKCKESYSDIKICCNPVFSEFNELVMDPTLVVDTQTYELDMYFNGDMKFIQICMGLSGSTSNYACPWCYVSKDERKDISKEADYFSSSEMKRTLSSLKTNAGKKSFGSKEMPLIEIEPDKIVPDELHLFLRVSDILLQNIIDDCRQLDDKAMTYKQPVDHLDRLVRAINEIGINFHTWTDNSGMPQYTSLSGSDYKRLFGNLPQKLLFVINNDTFDDTTYLMREILNIHDVITNKFTDKTETFVSVRTWMERFISLNDKGRVGYNRITPYMHCLLFHVPNFASQHNGIGRFSGQGVEKLNDQIKFLHQKRSNKNDQTIDELKTRKRLEYLKDSHCERVKQSYTKVNDSYWNDEIKEKQSTKRRKIDFEIEEAHRKFEKENKKSPDKMTISEIKESLKSLGVSTKLRSRKKLENLLKEHIS